jgi:TorA maturation chaperone TorD
VHSNHSTIIGNITFYRVTLEFLSQVFLDPPNQALMKHLVQANPFKDWPVDSDAPDLRRGLDLLASFCEHWTPAQLEALTLDYTRLFLGLDRTLAAPYESVFLSDDHLMFERQTLEVRALYEQYDLQVPKKHQIPDDHLSYELQFVAGLCDRLVCAWQGREHGVVTSLQKAICQFLDIHLLRWLPAFCDRVLAHGDTNFYKGMALVARVTAVDLRQDLKILSLRA